jgi:hypothetical protein
MLRVVLDDAMFSASQSRTNHCQWHCLDTTPLAESGSEQVSFGVTHRT